MPPIDCGQVDERLREHVAGELPASDRAEVEAHLAACAACAVGAARERRLATLLDGLPAAPALDVPVPAIPDFAPVVEAGRPAGRVLRMTAWAAAAAAALLVATRLVGTSVDPVRDVAGREFAGARIRRFVDDRDVRPDWDERTLALAAGVEAVATLRPADGR